MIEKNQNEWEELPDIIAKTAQKQFGIEAPLPYQRLVINSTLCGCGYYGEELQAEEPKRRIIILPTGAGKSLCFMLPYFLIEGTTVVVFPLLSLIGDQARRCEEAGIEAVVLKGGLSIEEKEAMFEKMRNWKRGLLLCNMEILLAKGVLEKLKEVRISNLVFDEVHTLFEWGDSFRPTLQRGGEIIRALKPMLVNAFTATASEKGIERIQELLFQKEIEAGGEPPIIINADPDRPNISYHLLPTMSKKRILLALFLDDEKLQEGLDATLPIAQRPAILFFRNRRETERTAAYLRHHLKNIPVYHYHAGLPKPEKAAIERAFFQSDNGILCSTNAYGMGVDKPNIRTVIHIQFPPTLESYLQESGRAGRDKAPSKAFLMVRPEELGYREIHPALLQFATCNDRCRREALMKYMGREEVICSGCDVCNQTVLKRLPNEEALLKTIHHLRKDKNLREIKRTIWKSTPKYYPALLPYRNWSSCQLDELFQNIKAITNC